MVKLFIVLNSLTHCTMNKTGSNSGHFVKYWVKLTLLKYTNKMVISDQKRKINGTAPKIPKVYQVWQLSCYSTQPGCRVVRGVGFPKSLLCPPGLLADDFWWT